MLVTISASRGSTCQTLTLQCPMGEECVKVWRRRGTCLIEVCLHQSLVQIQRRISGSSTPPFWSECVPSPQKCLTSYRVPSLPSLSALALAYSKAETICWFARNQLPCS